MEVTTGRTKDLTMCNSTKSLSPAAIGPILAETAMSAQPPIGPYIYACGEYCSVQFLDI